MISKRVTSIATGTSVAALVANRPRAVAGLRRETGRAAVVA